MNQHRVRFFTHDIHATEAVNKSKQEIFWLAAKKFQETDKYAWVEENGVTLQYDVDDLVTSWFMRVMFYANLDEMQYINYTLRFFKHNQEDWR